MQRNEIWSVSMARICDFFDTQPDVCKTDTGYRYLNCQITLQALPPKETPFFHTPRTQIIFDGQEQSVSRIYHRFVLQFLTTGG